MTLLFLYGNEHTVSLLKSTMLDVEIVAGAM
jgi:hypothetical protein